MGEREELLESLFHAARRLATDERAGFLERSCPDDFELRREVEDLLELAETPDDRLDEPAPRLVALGRGETQLLLGKRLGPYRVTRSLAAGGMGVVYEAVQEQPRRSVALKVMRMDLATREEQRRFRVESSLLARLRHPHIAHVYGADVATIDGLSVPYIAMELVADARPITAYAAEERLSLEARIELFALVCEAVEHGHRQGVVHRDLKPANVLVDGEGVPKLIDFGVARALGSSATTRTATGVLLGTIQYMSPEQCADARELDARSDVYSLGVMLYELVCGSLPHDLAEKPLPQAVRILQEESPRRPSTVLRAVRGDLETILLKALEKDRARRYASAAALAADLRRFLAHEPIAARPASAAYRLRLLASRHRAATAALVTIVTAALAAAVVSYRFALRERDAREREAYAAARANVAAADASLRAFDAAGARRRLARVPAERRGWEWRHLRTRSDAALRVLEGTGPFCKGVDWRDGAIASVWEDPEPEVFVLLLEDEGAAERSRVGPFPGGSEGVALSPSGSVVWVTQGGRGPGAAGDGEPLLHEWDPHGGSLRSAQSGHAAPVVGIGVDPDGRIATASFDGRLLVRAALDAPAVPVLEGQVPWHALALSPDGRWAALGGADGDVRVVALADGGDELVLDGPGGEVYSLGFDRAGERLAAGSRAGLVQVWDLREKTTLARLSGHSSEVRGVRFLGSMLATCSNDGTVRVWDLDTGTARNVLSGHESWVTALASSPSDDRLLSGSFDGTLRLWSPLATPGLQRLDAHTGIVRDLAFSPDDRLLLTGSRDGTARLFETAAWRESAVLDDCGGRLWSVAFHPSGELFATGADDGLVRLWRPGEARPRHELGGHERAVSALAFAPDGALLASGSWDGRVIVRETASLRSVLTLEHAAVVNRVAFSPDGSRLATVDQGGLLRLWDVRDGRELWRRQAEQGFFQDVCFSPDGGRLATGSGTEHPSRRAVQLWDARTGSLVRDMSGEIRGVNGVAFSPDGSRLASASADGAVRLWDPDTGAELLTLRGHESWAWSLAFSHDGTLLASGGGNYDGTGTNVHVWTTR